jgi:hypothetical protein
MKMKYTLPYLMNLLIYYINSKISSEHPWACLLIEVVTITYVGDMPKRQ